MKWGGRKKGKKKKEGTAYGGKKGRMGPPLELVLTGKPQFSREKGERQKEIGRWPPLLPPGGEQKKKKYLVFSLQGEKERKGQLRSKETLWEGRVRDDQ